MAKRRPHERNAESERQEEMPGGSLDGREIDSLAGKGGAREEVSADQPERLRITGADESGLPSDARPERRTDGIGRPDFPDLDEAGVPHIEPDQVQRWAKTLDVSAQRLREAIRRVGPVVEDVKRFLASDGKGTA